MVAVPSPAVEGEGLWNPVTALGVTEEVWGNAKLSSWLSQLSGPPPEPNPAITSPQAKQSLLLPIVRSFSQNGKWRGRKESSIPFYLFSISSSSQDLKSLSVVNKEMDQPLPSSQLVVKPAASNQALQDCTSQFYLWLPDATTQRELDSSGSFFFQTMQAEMKPSAHLWLKQKIRGLRSRPGTAVL